MYHIQEKKKLFVLITLKNIKIKTLCRKSHFLFISNRIELMVQFTLYVTQYFHSLS